MLVMASNDVVLGSRARRCIFRMSRQSNAHVEYTLVGHIFSCSRSSKQQLNNQSSLVQSIRWRSSHFNTTGQ